MSYSVEVWPDNLQAVNVFIAMSTQWRIGMSGASGLDYNVLPIVMKLMQVPNSDKSSVFEDVRTMENAALAEMRAE